jgi:NAD-dependent DNA ligase
MEVADSVDADIIIYITKDKEESSQWKCMWRFKNWGFSNFSIFIASDSTQLLMKPEDAFEGEEYTVEIDGTIYFTNDPAEARYRDPYFRLPGVMRIIKYKE